MAYYDVYRDGSIASSESALTVTGLTCSGSTATATMASYPGFLVGEYVTISGANAPQYDGTFVITAVSGDTFSYVISGTAASPDSSTSITALLTGQVAQLSGETTISFADTSVTAGTTYTYTVAAVNRDGYSGPLSTSLVKSLPADDLL